MFDAENAATGSRLPISPGSQNRRIIAGRIMCRVPQRCSESDRNELIDRPPKTYKTLHELIGCHESDDPPSSIEPSSEPA
jgi:hypothetical protein